MKHSRSRLTKHFAANAFFSRRAAAEPKRVESFQRVSPRERFVSRVSMYCSNIMTYWTEKVGRSFIRSLADQEDPLQQGSTSDFLLDLEKTVSIVADKRVFPHFFSAITTRYARYSSRCVEK